MATRDGNTAATFVISQTDLQEGQIRKWGIGLTSEQFKREACYRATISIAKSMLQRGLINENEYKKIDTIMFEKYHPLLGGLYR